MSWSLIKCNLFLNEFFLNEEIESESEDGYSDFENLFDKDLELFGIEDVKTKRNCIKNYVEEIVPTYSDAEFLSHFRTSRSLSNWMARQFENSSYMERLDQTKVTPAYKQVLIWLWFAGHEGCCYVELKDRFDVSVGSAWNFIRRVTCFLSDLSAEFIKFPNLEQQRKSARQIFRTKGFPGVIGTFSFKKKFMI